jgi:DNA-binding NarL/FixJ family response regulator
MTQARVRTILPQNGARIFLIDDYPIIRYSLRQLLTEEKGFDVVGEAAGAADALSGIRATHPQLVVTDVSMSEGDGMNLIKEIHTMWPNIKILIVSRHNDPTHAERALRAGANGYVTKEQATERIEEAVRSLLRDQIYLSPDLSDSLMQRALQSRNGLQSNPIDLLSDRELQVFELLGEGLSTRETSERLSLSIKTIETYRDNIKRKFSLRTGTELTHRAITWKMEHETV